MCAISSTFDIMTFSRKYVFFTLQTTCDRKQTFAAKTKRTSMKKKKNTQNNEINGFEIGCVWPFVKMYACHAFKRRRSSSSRRRCRRRRRINRRRVGYKLRRYYYACVMYTYLHGGTCHRRSDRVTARRARRVIAMASVVAAAAGIVSDYGGGSSPSSSALRTKSTWAARAGRGRR